MSLLWDENGTPHSRQLFCQGETVLAEKGVEDICQDNAYFVLSSVCCMHCLSHMALMIMIIIIIMMARLTVL